MRFTERQPRDLQRERRAPAVWPVTLLFYTCMLPPEVHVDLGTMRIYAYRGLLILLVPAVARKIARGEVRLSLLDVSLVLSGLWFIMAMSAHYGFANGLEEGGALSLDLIMAFMTARCYICDIDAFRRVLTQGVWAVIAAGLIMMTESFSGRLILRPMLGKIFGVDQSAGTLAMDHRLGLLRAYGPFPHPILGGLQMSSLIPLYGFVVIRGQKRLIGLVGAFMGLFALSSAALIGTFGNVGSMIYETLRRRIPQLSWSLAAWTVAGLLLAAQFLSQNGVLFVIIRYLTLDPATGNYRVLTWTYAGRDAMDHPIWGVGREHWDRPGFMLTESVDAHWLWLSLRYGLPASLTLAVTAIGTLVLLQRRITITAEGRERRALVGIFVSLFMLLLLMFTVTLWSNSMAWLLLLLGAALSIAKTPPTRAVERGARRHSRLGFERRAPGPAVRGSARFN